MTSSSSLFRSALLANTFREYFHYTFFSMDWSPVADPVCPWSSCLFILSHIPSLLPPVTGCVLAHLPVPMAVWRLLHRQNVSSPHPWMTKNYGTRGDLGTKPLSNLQRHFNWTLRLFALYLDLEVNCIATYSFVGGLLAKIHPSIFNTVWLEQGHSSLK